MIAYHELYPDEKTLIITTEKNTAFAEEYYCSNPHCQCNNVLLVFNKAVGNTTREILYIYFDFDLWQLDKSAKNKVPPEYEDIVKEILQLPEEKRNELSFAGRYKKVKDYGIQHPETFVDVDFFEFGSTYTYAEIFGLDNENALYFFDFKGKQFAVMDTYCIDPACKCRSIVLAFFPALLKKGTPIFVIDYYLNDRYDVREIYQHSDLIGPLVNHLRKHHKAFLQTIKDRYHEAKYFGKRLRAYQKSQSVAHKQKQVGRNEPCPCGSGKKYKKCCGKEA